MRRALAPLLFTILFPACSESSGGEEPASGGQAGARAGQSGASGKGGHSGHVGASGGIAGAPAGAGGAGAGQGDGGSGAAGLAGQGGVASAAGASGKGGSGSSAGASSGGGAGMPSSVGGGAGMPSGAGGASEAGSAGATSLCGNGVHDLGVGEWCDGDDLGEYKDCKSYFAGQFAYASEGTLKCSPLCIYDVSGCTICGDGKREGPEECDGAEVPATLTCQAVLGGTSAGPLTCAQDCRPDVSACSVACDPITNAGCGSGVCVVELTPSNLNVKKRLRCSANSPGSGSVCEKTFGCKVGLVSNLATNYVCLPYCQSDADCMGTACDFNAGADGFGLCVSYPCP